MNCLNNLSEEIKVWTKAETRTRIIVEIRAGLKVGLQDGAEKILPEWELLVGPWSLKSLSST